MKLPSGRKLSYPQPRVLIQDERRAARSLLRQRRWAIQGLPSRPRRLWRLWAENIVSGIARDILVEAMLRIEAAGYPIVLHVHDEIVAEVPQGFGSREELIRLMTRRPAWALELPIAANAWRESRYYQRSIIVTDRPTPGRTQHSTIRRQAWCCWRQLRPVAVLESRRSGR